MKYCKCHEILTLKEALSGLKDETIEFFQEPSMDEASDIAYCINRLLGTLSGKPIVNLLPANLHIEKIKQRMDDYQCIRSPRHLINGKCPSE